MSHFLSLILLTSLPLQWTLPLWSGWDIPLARALSLMIIVAFLFERLYQRKFPIAPLSSALLVSFLLWALFSLLWAERLDLAFPKIAFLFNLLPLFFVWFVHLQEKTNRIQCIQWFLVGAGAASLLGLVLFFTQFVFGVNDTFHFLIDTVLPFFLGQELSQMVASYPSLLVNIGGITWLRVTAVFPDPHVAAFFFGLSGFLALGFTRLVDAPHWTKILPLILFISVILTFSRGGYLGLLFGAFAYQLYQGKHEWPKLGRYMPLIAGVGITATLFFGQPVISRFLTSFTLNDTSSTERVRLWTEALGKIGENPFLGTGMGNYLTSVHPLASTTTPFYAHNLSLDITLELGLIGSLAFFGLIGFTLFRLWTLRQKPFAAAIGAALVFYLTYSFFETALFSLHITILLMFLLALSESLKSQELLQ